MTTTTEPKAVTKDDLAASRVLKARPGPSGNHYDVRPINLERMALSGGLPTKLRAVASEGIAGLNRMLKEGGENASEDERLVRDWIDRLVAEVIVGPVLWKLDPEGERIHVDGQPQVDQEMIDLLPPVDYHWAAAIAIRECDTDGQGRRLWGLEPLSRWAAFREHHGCEPDCESCERSILAISGAL